MDPNAAAKIMRDPHADLDERIDATHDLSDWVNGGGFPQRIPLKSGLGFRSFGGNTAARFAALEEINGYLRTFRSLVEAKSKRNHPSNAV